MFKPARNELNDARSASPTTAYHTEPSKKQEHVSGGDQRRNLYVLGIPHHMTLEELKELFGKYGIVKHAVILAVLDAFRRRRGFIVMNSNGEAAAAMKGMSGSVVL